MLSPKKKKKQLSLHLCHDSPQPPPGQGYEINNSLLFPKSEDEVLKLSFQFLVSFLWLIKVKELTQTAIKHKQGLKILGLFVTQVFL